MRQSRRFYRVTSAPSSAPANRARIPCVSRLFTPLSSLLTSHAWNQYSNGENAFLYFTETIGETGLYLLDEPENSLSPALQLQLAEFLRASLELRTQFIIATHSPLLLALEGAKVYDLSTQPLCERSWYELENIRLLHDFFMVHHDEFCERNNPT